MTSTQNPHAHPPGEPQLIVTRGLPASGKTTWARDYCQQERGVLVCRKAIDRMLHGDVRPSVIAERQTSEAIRCAIKGLLAAGHTVVLDGEHLRRWVLADALSIAAQVGVAGTVQDFTSVSVDECIRRDQQRPHADQVGAARIRELFDRHLTDAPVADIGMERALSRRHPASSSTADSPWAVIVDIDGTVAIPHHRHPHDMDNVADDLPNGAVIRTVEALASCGMHLVFCTSRPESARLATAQWLSTHIEADTKALLMRSEGDLREDYAVKQQIYINSIAPSYRAFGVFEDRTQVVQMWRALGLQVFQVDDGNF